MRESDFKKFGNMPPLRQESWLEIEGFIGIAHATQGAYLFDHELGQCWIPKRAVKFERKITQVAGEAEYRILVASWFNWTEKLRMMREGKLVSDEVLKARKEAEQFFEIGAEVRVSVMPKVKTLKGTKPKNFEEGPFKMPKAEPQPGGTDPFEKQKRDSWDELFGGFTTRDRLGGQEPKKRRGGVDFSKLLNTRRATEPFLDREGANKEIKKREKARDLKLKRLKLREMEDLREKEAQDKLKIDLRELRGDLRYYLQNDAENLIDPTRKKILALILQKEELGLMKTSKDNRFINKLREGGVFQKWADEIESGETEKPKPPEPKGRAIDL